MSVITNKPGNTFSEKLKSVLPECDRIDALVGYFYFSGFQDLYQDLEDKTIRILVGMDIDKKIIEKVSTLEDLNLDSHVTDTKISSRSGARLLSGFFGALGALAGLFFASGAAFTSSLGVSFSVVIYHIL